MKSRLLLAFFAAISLQGADPIALDPILTAGPLKFTRANLDLARARLGFQWMGEDRNEARFEGGRYSLFSTMPLVEARMDFAGNHMNKATFLLYSRGDTGVIPESEFQGIVDKAREGMEKTLGLAATFRGREKEGVVATNGYTWTKDTGFYALEYSSSGNRGDFVPEFIRIVLTPPAGALSLQEEMNIKQKSGSTRPEEAVERLPNGDVFVKGVPMVDQGDKGYCVVATAERLFKYYGIPADQHEMAQLAKSSATGGTNPDRMMEELKPMQTRLKFRLRDLIRLEWKDFLGLVEDHNRSAKKNNKSLMPNPEATRLLSLAGADAEILSEVRAKQAGASRFERYVVEFTEKGIPLMWSLQLGIFPEKGVPQEGGGHMRMIIGFNAKSREVLYSDSWGVGHELKRMPIDHAWAVTCGVYAMEPLSRN
jgi:hypothetical protein